jgi:hypothetical protein
MKFYIFIYCFSSALIIISLASCIFFMVIKDTHLMTFFGILAIFNFQLWNIWRQQ